VHWVTAVWKPVEEKDRPDSEEEPEGLSLAELVMIGAAAVLLVALLGLGLVMCRGGS